MNDLNGKTILITGGTNGIGKAAALELTRMGARVVIVGRNPEKTQATVKEIQSQSRNSEAGFPAVEGLVADLSSMAEVRRVAQEFLSKYDRLDVLINNAGAVFAQRKMTIDGYERTFAFNHLAYFLLTNLLLPVLKTSAPARIINVSSGAHVSGPLDFANLQNEKYSMGGMRAYGQSKLANVLFTYELAHRLEGTGVTVNALHPGTVATGFGENNPGLMRIAMKLFHRFSIPPEEGADTVVYLASAPEAAGVTGKYWYKRKAEASSPESYDEAAQKRLWEISAEMTGLTVEQGSAR